jgi:thiamine transport system permease protein
MRHSSALTPRALLKGALYFLPLLFFALFYFYPTAAVLRLGLVQEGELNLRAIRETLISTRFARVLWFTLWQATLSTALTLLVAFPGAYVLARYRFPGKSIARALATLPFVLPTVVVATAFTALIGPRGIINNWLVDLFALSSPPIRLSQTVWIILLAHVFYNYSVALRILGGFWATLPPSLTQAAQVLGASPLRTFREVTLPLLRPALTAAAVLIFIYTFTSFGVIVILGGPRFATLEVEIYRQTWNLFNIPAAAALSLWQILFTFVLMAFYTRTQHNMARPLLPRSLRAAEQPVTTRRARLFVAANSLLMLVLIGAPLLALIARSFSGAGGPTLAFYRQLFRNERGSVFFVPPAEAIANSLGFAVVATLLAVSLGLISAQLLTRVERSVGRRPTPAATLAARLLDPLLMLPLATSAVTLGLGYLIGFSRPPFAWRSSLLLVPVAHALVAIPFVLRSTLPALRSVSPSLREAAAVMGADSWRVWRAVDWPLIRGALLVGAVFAFTISMGEFGATVFIARPETPTMPVAIFRFLGQPGATNYGQALAMSVLLMLVCAAGFLAIERFRAGDEGEL